MAVSRDKLFEEVWAEPMTTVAKRYNVSSSFLARVCQRMGVPRPPRGYWAQRAAGNETEPPALPAPEPGSDLEWVQDGSQPQRQPLKTEVASRAPRRRERPATHPLLVGARKHFDNAREARDGAYVRPFKRHIVDVFVSEEFLDDGLKFANELFLALEDRGYRVVLAPETARSERVAPEVCVGLHEYYYHAGPGRWRPSCPTVVIIEDLSIGLAIFEVGEEVEVAYDRKLQKYVRLTAAQLAASTERRTLGPEYQVHATTRWLPSRRIGLLAYTIDPGLGWKHYWRESKPGEFASKLDPISRELHRALPTIKALVAKRRLDAAEANRRAEAQHREWSRKDAERRQAELEKSRENEIVDVVGRARMAREIRAYVSEVHSLVKDAGLELVTDGEAECELKWALAYADRIDPLVRWRTDIAQIQAAEKCQPCPKFGKVHVSCDDDAGVRTVGSRGGEDGPQRNSVR